MYDEFYVDGKTGRVYLIKPPVRTHEECVRAAKRKKVRKAQKAARRRNRR